MISMTIETFGWLTGLLGFGAGVILMSFFGWFERGDSK